VIRELADRVRPVLQVSEIRTIAADRLWISPQYGRDTVGVHFTWRPDAEAVTAVLSELERALAPFEARPHWGKCFRATADRLAPAYPRLDEFRALADRLDPGRKLRNDFLGRHLGLAL